MERRTRRLEGAPCRDASQGGPRPRGDASGSSSCDLDGDQAFDAADFRAKGVRDSSDEQQVEPRQADDELDEREE